MRNYSSIFDLIDVIEPRSMHGQPKVLWHRAHGCYVFDDKGNRFIDFTSAVLVTNVGHGHPKIMQSIRQVLAKGLLTSYIFINTERIKLIKKILQKVKNYNMDQVMLFSTGSEAVEVSLKLSKMYSIKNYGVDRRIVISFDGAFHGRTLGAQMVGGVPAQKDWISDDMQCYIQVPFPEENSIYSSFNMFLKYLETNNVDPKNISAIIFEPIQGGRVRLASSQFMRDLRQWTKSKDIILIADEVQTGFGRTGKWWGIEHYKIGPDIIVCGKGISSSLPLSGVIGPKYLLDQFDPGSLSTTHSGNPLCAAAAYASIKIIENECLVNNSFIMGNFLLKELRSIASRFECLIENVSGVGLMCAMHFKNSKVAYKFVENCIDEKVMLFNPVGINNTVVKIVPPLCINNKILKEGLRGVVNACKKMGEI